MGPRSLSTPIARRLVARRDEDPVLLRPDDCSFSDDLDCKTTGDIGPYHTLYVMNADGSAQVRLTDAFGQIADWSLNGSYVVFEDFEDREGVSLIRSDGSGLTKLALDLPSPGFPDWISLQASGRYLAPVYARPRDIGFRDAVRPGGEIPS